MAPLKQARRERVDGEDAGRASLTSRTNSNEKKSYICNVILLGNFEQLFPIYATSPSPSSNKYIYGQLFPMQLFYMQIFSILAYTTLYINLKIEKETLIKHLTLKI